MTSALSLLALGGCTAGEECDSGEKSGDTGCIADDADADTDTDADSDTDSDTDADATVSTDWNTTGVTLTVTGGTASGYYFGMAQTKATTGWLGEDCVSGNADAETAYGYDRCHNAGATGGNWVSKNLGVAAEEEEFRNDTTDQYTAMNDTVAAAGEITYILMDTGAGNACWVWGEDVAYYDAYGCTDISP